MFRLSGTEGKNRLPSGVEVSGVRLMTLSTSNVPLAHLIKAPRPVVEALQARMVTLDLSHGHPFGVLDSVPPGFGSAREAMERLEQATADFHASVARAFVRRLVEERAGDEERLRGWIARMIAHFNTSSGSRGTLRWAEPRTPSAVFRAELSL